MDDKFIERRTQIISDFGYHKATEVTGPIHQQLRAKYTELALWIQANTPYSRDQSLALTALKESAMWANSAVAMTAPLVEE